MSKRVAKMSKIDINHKFYDQEEACKYAKRLVKAIDFICKKGKYKCSGVISASNIIGKAVVDYYYERTGNVGKPKIIREVITDDEKIKELNYGNLGESGELGNVYVGWHLHVLILSYPGETVRLKIKKYINKNWKNISKFYPSTITPEELDEIIKKKQQENERKKMFGVADENQEKQEKNKEEKKVYGKDCDTGYAEYMFQQSENLFFIDVDYSIPSKKEQQEFDRKCKTGIDFIEYANFSNRLEGKDTYMSFKKLFEERLRLNTLFHYGSFSRAEKSKEEKRYNEMLDYYKPFHENYTKKSEEEKKKRRDEIIKRNIEKRNNRHLE